MKKFYKIILPGIFLLTSLNVNSFKYSPNGDFQEKDSLYYEKLLEKDPDNMYHFYDVEKDTNLMSSPDSAIYDSTEKDFFENSDDDYEDEEGW
jgi:hypothetical protein